MDLTELIFKLRFKMQKTRIFQIIEPSQDKGSVSNAFDIFIMSLIVLNITAVILASFNGIEEKLDTFLFLFEVFSVSIFSIEYILRVYTSSIKYPGESAYKAVFIYIFSPMALIDLFAILPFYLPLLIPFDLRFLRILRLTRLLRVLKINRYSNSLQLLTLVLHKKKEELLVTIFVTMILIILASSMMYYLENEEQPESFPNIIASIWWAIATLTTVGYGDVYPITFLGKVLAGIIALLGIGLVALPTGIISSGFLEEFSRKTIFPRSRKIDRSRIKHYRIRKINQLRNNSKFNGGFHV